MSVYGIPEEAHIVALSPAVFYAVCVQCGLWRRVLPWQVSANGSWGAVCDECGKGVLLRQLRSRLFGSFKKVELSEALLRVGVNKKEAELLISDFERAGAIVLIPTSGFYIWRETTVVEPLTQAAVKPISEPKRAHKRVCRRKKTRQEIATRCRMLAREIRGRSLEAGWQHADEKGFVYHNETRPPTPGEQAVSERTGSGKALDFSMLPSTDISTRKSLENSEAHRK